MTSVVLRLSGQHQLGVGIGMVPTSICQVGSNMIVNYNLEIIMGAHLTLMSHESTLCGNTRLKGYGHRYNSSRVLMPGLDSISVRLIIPHTIMQCVVGGPTGEGRPVRAWPCDCFMGSSGHPSSKLPIRWCDTSYISFSHSSPWSEGIV
ncbi:hypothetical protein TIFTF001_030869 [Ficus carica]|uniref:Uncharacterized protein n=1 Tax=Ficus carica TaxID=3494 RepID=A0AA88J3G4_FICCA|nr:hypothetical protein TIFTF001_030869 [Ficus carica]